MWRIILHENHGKQVIKLKSQDQISEYEKQEGYFNGCINGSVNGWIEGYIEGFTKETLKNLLEKLQNDILKTDKQDTLENTKEKITKQIIKVIFEQYHQEIESLENEAYDLAKNKKKRYSEVINTLFK